MNQAILVLLAGCLALPAAFAGPLDLARDAVEKSRDDTHRAKARIVWPSAADAKPPVPGTEVFLIEGYINYTCTRLVWRENDALVQRVKAGRSWAYNPRGEFFDTAQFTIPAAAFRQAWEAAALVRDARVEIAPTPTPPAAARRTHLAGWSSHEPHFFIRLWDRSGVLLDWYLRGRNAPDGIRQWSDLQTLALIHLFDPGQSGDARPFALAEWEPLLTQLFRQGLLDSRTPSGHHRGEFLTEVSLRLLGESGSASALSLLDEVKPGSSERISRECRYARARLDLRLRFDASAASEIIHSAPRALLPDLDLIQWVRNLCFEKDPAAYRRLLDSDLRRADAPEALLRESIADLRRKYPGDGADLLAALLENKSPEIVSDAALALLATDPRDSAALRALDRIASDPRAPIPEGAKWHSYFGRERALDYLYSINSPVPPEFRWDAARLRRQIAVEGEDGRMMNRFLTALRIVDNREVPPDEQIAAYRRSLSGAAAPGLDCAREHLSKLGVKE